MITRSLLLWYHACVLLAPFLASALTVRVVPTNGIPRLLVDGVPVRPRMFYGASGHAPLELGSEWKPLDFEFVASGSASNGTLHFRFGEGAGEVFLDDITISNVTTRELLTRSDFSDGLFASNWTSWPAGAANTVGIVDAQSTDSALRVRLQAPADRRWPDFHVYHRTTLRIDKGSRYRVTFRARSSTARQLAVALYRPGDPYVRIGGPPDIFAQQIALARTAGVYFITFPVELPWPKPGSDIDWTAVDAAIDAVLAANAEALLIPRVPMDPPKWWRDANPDDVMHWEDGQHDKAAVASPRYRRDAADRLRLLVEHLESKYGERIAGYHPCGQNTGEWFYEGTWKRELSGYSPVELTGWRTWLRRKYFDSERPGHDGAELLRRSWDMPDVTFDNAPLPTPEQRRRPGQWGAFRDPEKERPLLEFAEFQQEAMAECVLGLARTVREASQGRKLVVFFYGYVFEFGAVENGPTTSGHYDLRRVLRSPDIDILCSPISYFDRGLGGSAPAMSAAESVTRAGKLWLNEDDTHTYRATGTQPGHQDHAGTVEETIALLTRNVAQEATRNFGTWWMDLGATGWFNDPLLWKQWTKLRDIDEPFQLRPSRFEPEVAAIIDDQRSMRMVGPGATAVIRPAIYDVRAPLGRMGAPYGQYLLDDVRNRNLKAKLYIFLNAWRLTKRERIDFQNATMRATRVWCYAPGMFDERSYSSGFSLQAMQELTGFEHKLQTTTARATPTEQGRALGLTQPFGIDRAVSPLFAAVDAKPEEVLARYADGAPAVALRRNASGPSLFVGPPGLSSELLRVAAREARVHLFTTNDCNVYANGDYIALHAAQEGTNHIHLRHRAKASDVVTGQPMGDGVQFSIPMKRGETRVLRIEEGTR